MTWLPQFFIIMIELSQFFNSNSFIKKAFHWKISRAHFSEIFNSSSEKVSTGLTRNWHKTEIFKQKRTLKIKIKVYLDTRRFYNLIFLIGLNSSFYFNKIPKYRVSKTGSSHCKIFLIRYYFLLQFLFYTLLSIH